MLSLFLLTFLHHRAAASYERKGKFALLLQGGALWDAFTNNPFENTHFLLNPGLEYYFEDALALGSQIAFAQTRYTAPPTGCLLGCGEEPVTDRLYQSGFYARLVEAEHKTFSFYILVGATLNYVNRQSRQAVTPAGDDGFDPVKNPFGFKFGTGFLIRVTPRVGVNIGSALDTKPEILSSVGGGILFFLGAPTKPNLPSEDTE